MQGILNWYNLRGEELEGVNSRAGQKLFTEAGFLTINTENKTNFWTFFFCTFCGKTHLLVKKLKMFVFQQKSQHSLQRAKNTKYFLTRSCKKMQVKTGWGLL